MTNQNIIFEGDYLRDTDGSISQIINIQKWDENGDAELRLANGRVVNSIDVTMNNILLASEVF